MMIELEENEIELVSGGGAAGTIGNWIGNVAGELAAHPEASLLGPVGGAIYLLTRH